MENRNPPLGSRVGAANYCVPGSIPGPGVICGLSVLLVLYSAPRLFSPGTPVFPSPLDVRHFSHEPLARVIAKALPVLDVKFTFNFTFLRLVIPLKHETIKLFALMVRLE